MSGATTVRCYWSMVGSWIIDIQSKAFRDRGMTGKALSLPRELGDVAHAMAAGPELVAAASAVDADIEAQGAATAESIEKLRLALAKARRV